MNLSGLDVVVCGAATAGCSVALFLPRAGANVTVAERVPEPKGALAALGCLAEATNPFARALRDTVLMPIASLFAQERATHQLFQEPPALLRQIGVS